MSDPAGTKTGVAMSKDDELTTVVFGCGPNPKCEHDFKGWREFEDGRGGEAVCTKCGIGAMQHSLWTGP